MEELEQESTVDLYHSFADDQVILLSGPFVKKIEAKRPGRNGKNKLDCSLEKLRLFVHVKVLTTNKTR